MAIRKRGSTWLIDYYDPSGKRVVKGGFKSRKAARLEESARLEAIDQGMYYKKVKHRTVTFAELVEKYKENFKQQRSYERSKKYMIEVLEEEFSGKLLNNISYLNLETYRNKLKSTLSEKGKILSDATVNRYMACLRHMLAKAVTWDMLNSNPFEKGESLQLKENNKRLRFLSEEEIVKVLAECPTTPAERVRGRFVAGTQATYLKSFITIAINSGMRKGEILSLKWDQIREGFIYLSKTKTNKARQVPVNNDLAECFKSIRTKQKLGTKCVICDEKGRRLKDIKTAFNSAMKRAGITDFRPHDLRHTFASHYIMRGGSLAALQKILGHADIKMTMRYAHLSQEFAQAEIQLLNGLTSDKKITGGNNLVTSANSKFATTS